MWSYSYMQYVSLDDYMMKIVDMNGVVLMCYVDVLSVKISCLMKSLLSMCEVMRLHMYNSLVDYDWGHE